MIRDHPRERTRSGTRLLTGFETYILNRINDGSAGSGLIDTLPFHVAVAACELFGAVASFERACIPDTDPPTSLATLAPPPTDQRRQEAFSFIISRADQKRVFVSGAQF